MSSRAKLSLVLTALLAAALAAPSAAAAMYCSDRLVLQGDGAARVSSLCGEPARVDRRVIHRSRALQRRLPDGSVITDFITTAVELESWTFDFGPQRFMRVVTFERGVVVDIQTLGYGTPR